MQASPQSAFNQRRATNHGAAAEIAFRRDVHFPVRSNRSAKARRDLVILEINVRATGWTNTRARRGTDLLFRFTFETFDHGILLSSPESLEFAAQRRRFFHHGDRFWRSL